MSTRYAQHVSLLEESEDHQRFIDFTTQQYLHFEVQGRLGNQLFGLSDAYRLGRHFNRKVLLDIKSVTHEYGKPDWVIYASHWDWAELVDSEVVHSEEQGYKKVNVGLLDPLKQDPNSHFHGFTPSISSVESSGLFAKGVFPFPSDDNDLVKVNQLALCVRRGDYHQNPHLGILPSTYYKKALSNFLPLQQIEKIVVFCDSIEETIEFLESNEIFYNEINQQENALEALRDLSKSSKIIAANSTFSFWGCYFSNSISYFPDPFYLSQPRWGRKLTDGFEVIKYVRMPRIYYFTQLLIRKLKSHI